MLVIAPTGLMALTILGADRALCARHLARQLVMALQAELEFGDVATPAFHRYEEPWVQWGGPNPDNLYARAAIDPAATYRVFGSRHIRSNRSWLTSPPPAESNRSSNPPTSLQHSLVVNRYVASKIGFGNPFFVASSRQPTSNSL